MNQIGITNRQAYEASDRLTRGDRDRCEVLSQTVYHLVWELIDAEPELAVVDNVAEIARSTEQAFRLAYATILGSA